MQLHLLPVVLALAAAVPLGGALQDEVYTEEVVVTPLHTGRYWVHFHLQQETKAVMHHFSFPRAISYLSNNIPFTELQLHLTHGRWKYSTWGVPTVAAKPAGAELWASFNKTTPPADLADHWSDMTHALSGLLCASLNLLGDPHSVASPSLAPSQQVHKRYSSARTLHAALPREAVCTENLTPWLKLLPCRDQAGLMSLLANRQGLYSSEYLSMALHVSTQRDPHGAVQSIKLQQTLSIVLQPGRQAQQQQERGAQAPYMASPAGLQQLMGSRVLRLCPPAARSTLYVDSSTSVGGSSGSGIMGVAADGGAAAGAPEVVELGIGDASLPSEHGEQLGHQNTRPWLHAYDTASWVGGDANPTSAVPSPSSPSHGEAGPATPQPALGALALAPPLEVSRFLTGSGTLHGTMVLLLRQHAAATAAAAAEAAAATSLAGSPGPGQAQVRMAQGGVQGGVVCVLQVLPWQVRLLMHTMQLRVDGQVLPLAQHLLTQRLQPARARASPGVMELCLRLPSGGSSAGAGSSSGSNSPDGSSRQDGSSALVLSVEFAKAFLTVKEYPPDSHRGFDVPAALITYVDPARAQRLSWRVAGGCSAVGGSTSSSGSGNGSSGACGGGAASSVTAGAVRRPLLEVLSGAVEQQVYSEGLLVQHANPDFSMPYNVICLTSTLLAVYVGATLNLLMKRQGQAGAASKKGSKKMEVAKVLALVVVFGGLAVYTDAELRDLLAAQYNQVVALLM